MNKRLRQWKPSDCVPGNSNIVFRKDNVDYYFQHLFHTSPTLSLQTATPLFIKDVYKLDKIEQVYLMMPILKNLYLYVNHPIHELQIYGRCLGVFYRDDSDFMLCFIDDGSCQDYLTCKVPISVGSVPNFKGKFLKLEGTLRMYKEIKELHVLRYEVLGDESNFDIQFKSWERLLDFKERVLANPWVYTNTEFVDEEDRELVKLYEQPYEDENHTMTKTIYNGVDNQFEVIVISDAEDDDDENCKPCDLTQSLLDLKFEFVRYCLNSNKRKLSLQEIFNHLHQRLNEVLGQRLFLSNTLNKKDLKSIKFEIFHDIRHELTLWKLIKCTRNLNCKIDNLLLFATNLVKSLVKIIKNKNYIIKFNIAKYLQSFELKNNGITMGQPLLNKLIEYYINEHLTMGNGEWVSEGGEWVYTNNISGGRQKC